ncbi:cupin domain-containing protein [Marinomonas agarivorans]|nr:cupin domain-containing protein [Marinomonas agarivorans]
MNYLDRPLSILGGMSARVFLADYWQKQPLLIRQALADFSAPLDPNELAGLAMEEDVESRLVLENKQGDTPWQLHKGPFNEDDFANLPEQEWTLLVQALDHWVPEVQELKERFRFLPSWRLDDVMASYATEGGSVGPHYDQYDVFLVQVAGKRRWQVLTPNAYEDKYLTNTDLHILANFHPDKEMDWEVEQGDILYIPPNFAHYGRALDSDCMTYSIGFRAPSMQDVLHGISDKISTTDLQKRRFAAPSDHDEPHHAEIHQSDIEYLTSALADFINQPELLADWLGNYMSEVKYPEYHADLNQQETATALDMAKQGALFFRPGDARICYRYSTEPEGLILYCNGDQITINKALDSFIKAVCDQTEFDFSDILQQENPDITEVLNFLIRKQGLVQQIEE